MPNMNGKVALITGASSGIGRATAEAFAARSAKVVAAARRADELATLVTDIEARGGKAIPLPTDVSVASEVERLVVQTIETFGRLDFAVNNAGFEGTVVPEVGGGILDYSTARCAVDRPKNPTMAACGSRGTGTRVYDIRDPLHPAEIAYWKGPAPRTAILPGSGSWSPGVDRTVEKQAGFARFVKVPAAHDKGPDKGPDLNLWIVGDGNGCQVLRFTDDFLKSKPGKAIHDDAMEDSDDSDD